MNVWGYTEMLPYIAARMPFWLDYEVPHFPSEIVEPAKREHAWKSPHARKGKTRRGDFFLSPRRVSPFLAWGDFHARSRFTRSTIPEEKWGTTRSLVKTAYSLGSENFQSSARNR